MILNDLDKHCINNIPKNVEKEFNALEKKLALKIGRLLDEENPDSIVCSSALTTLLEISLKKFYDNFLEKKDNKNIPDYFRQDHVVHKYYASLIMQILSKIPEETRDGTILFILQELNQSHKN